MARPAELERLLPGAHVGDLLEVRTRGEAVRLAGDPDGLDLAAGGPLAQGEERLVQLGDGGLADDARAAVVLAVIERDQGHRAATAQVDSLGGDERQVDVADEDVGRAHGVASSAPAGT